MDDSARRAKLKIFFTAVLIFAFYFITAKLGLKLAFVNASATAIWAPTGIALAVFLIFGKQYWPSIFAGAFLVNLLTAGNLTTSLVIAGGNTLEGLLGALLVHQFANGRKVFERSSDILKFILFAEVISTAVSASVGVTILCIEGYASWNLYLDIWTTWWLGDLAGALLVTPLLVLWYDNPAINFRRLFVTSISFLLVGLIGQAVFGNWIFPQENLNVEFLCIPPLIWIAFRFGTKETATASLLLCGIALWNTIHGIGPFALSSQSKSLLLLQIYMSVISMTALVLAAAISERKIAEENLERAQKAEKQLQGKIELIQLLQSITVAANESMTLPEAVQLSLKLICRYLGWPVGHVYYVDQNECRQLKPGAQWFVRDENKYKNLRHVTDQRIFQTGEGLPGIVLTSASPRWIEDVTHYPNFPRAKMGLDINVRAAFGFPVMIGKNVVAVLEFFTDHPVPPNQELMESMGPVGTQLGRIIERHQSKQTQSELALLVETSSDFIVTTNPEGYILYLNEAGRNMVGLEKDTNVRLLKHLDFVFEKDIPKLQNEVMESLMSKGHWEGEFNLKNFKTGQPITTYFSAGILKDPQTGLPTTLAAIGHDVTDIKKAEMAVNNSNSFLSAILENIPNMIFVKDAKELRFVMFNKAGENLIGVPREKMIGKNDYDFFPKTQADFFTSKDRDVITEGSLIDIPEENIQTQNNGNRVLHTKKIPVFNEDGSPRFLLGISEDITDAKLAQKSLRESQENFRLLVASVQDYAIFLLDQDGHVVTWNEGAKKIKGYEADEIIGRHFSCFYTKEDIETNHFDELLKAAENQGHITDMGWRVRKDGSRFWADVVITSIRDDQGNLTGFAKVTRDITERRNAELELKKQAQLLQSIIDSMGEGLLVCDSQGKILFVNPAADHMLGGQIGDPLSDGKKQKNTVYQADGETILAPNEFPITRAIYGESSDNVELYIKNPKKPDGIYVVSTNRPIRDHEGKITGGVSVFRDITEQKHAEVERQRFVTLVENSRDMIVWSTMEGKNLYINEAGREMIGISPEMDISLIKLETLVHPEEVGQVKTLRDIQDEAIRERGFWEGEFNIPHQKTGKFVPIHFSIVMLKNSKTGKPIGTATIGRNMTERREAEKTLKESDTRFRSVVQSSPNAIITTNSKGNILSWNKAAENIFGHSEQEIIGKPFTDILSVKHRETYEINEAILKKPQGARLIGKTIELQGLRKTGVEFPIELSLSSWKIEDEIYFGGIIRDITERKKMEALLKSNAELQQFANVASHDLQEPLRMVASYVQLLSVHLKDKLDEDAKDYMGFAVDGAKRMQLLVNGLLEYSRVESRAQEPQAIDMNQIFNQTVSNLEIRIAETQAKISHGPLPRVIGDPVQLAQLMQNLFSNALKFKKPGIPEIDFSMREAEEEWVFACKDNGIGIDSKYFGRIFIIFQRLHHRDEYSGSGIGLAVCKRIVERHGGRIWVESKSNEGSTFFFTLPKKND